MISDFWSNLITASVQVILWSVIIVGTGLTAYYRTKQYFDKV